MERVRRLAALWSWLPAFRVVAECQHLPTASKQLHVSPSALSRTVRLLEEEVGQPLFVREGRSLRINDAGEKFLAATRDAMRILDEGLAVLDTSETAGPVHLSIPSQLAKTMAHALGALTAEHTRLIPTLHETPPEDLVPALLAGRLDVGMTDLGIDHERLKTHHVATLESRVYAAPNFDRSGIRNVEDFASQPFVAPPPLRSGASADGWPGGLERRVTMVAQSPAFALEVARAGHHLIYLPRVEAAFDVESGHLEEINLALSPPVKVFALTRPTIGPTTKADLVVEHLSTAFRTAPSS